MPQKSLGKSAILMAVIVAVVVVSCEIYLRKKGIAISYDDGPPLWSHQRAMVYAPSDKSVVFIGSSRIKYDLDIPTWNQITDCQAVQLAVEGSSPRSALQDLANDTHFKGRLIVDVTEGLFFSDDESATSKNIAYYRDLSPAQEASFHLNRALESGFVFLDKEQFSLNAQLDALEIPSRTGVFMMPIFPFDFGRTSFERQAYMTDKFLTDTSLQNKVKGIWHFFGSMAKGAPPMSEEDLTAIFQSVKAATDKIKARGGEVLFVRTPSNTDNLGEKVAFPREKYWDRLLTYSDCPGVHFLDYPAIDHFVCPELSHLSPQDAVLFTQEFVRILKSDKGWKL